MNKKEYKKMWAINNPDKVRASKAKWRKNNPEKVKDEYERNKQKYISRAKLWSEKNREKCRASSRSSFKRWYQRVRVQKPEYYKFLNSKTYARRRNAEGKHSFDEWVKIKQSFNYCCARCGLKEGFVKITKDHIIPLSLGGTDFADNLQPLCSKCNSSKGNKIFNKKHNETISV